MHIRVLGSAAGGGFPQWNCGCMNCAGVRQGTLRALPRTQECVAVSANGDDWALLNCSPEIRAQIESFPALHPRAARHSPIAAIVLTSGDLDHVLGVFSLRENHRLTLHATPVVRAGLEQGNTIWRTLCRFEGQVTWQPLDGAARPLVPGLTVRAVPAPGKPPLHLEASMAPHEGDNVALVVTEDATGRRFVYASSTAGITPALRAAMDGADAVFFDGTFWSADELGTQGLGTATAERMGHVPVGGANGSLAALEGLRAGRRILIHINNTNPLLREDSAERAIATRAGWEIAEDGMEIVL